MLILCQIDTVTKINKKTNIKKKRDKLKIVQRNIFVK